MNRSWSRTLIVELLQWLDYKTLQLLLLFKAAAAGFELGSAALFHCKHPLYHVGYCVSLGIMNVNNKITSGMLRFLCFDHYPSTQRYFKVQN